MEQHSETDIQMTAKLFLPKVYCWPNALCSATGEINRGKQHGAIESTCFSRHATPSIP